MENADLIDFDIIEGHKENIQALPSGRSAKALAALYSPPLTGGAGLINDEHSKKRAEFEQEVAQIDEADDPLDVYDRYVKWTINTYPSAQSTPQSQLLPLLERATKHFLQSQHYKNDPRYLKIWLQYIHFFSDSPREAFVFLSRNGVGESLALYYEEFAAWLETNSRWTQAEEVYKIGLEKEARPTERLMRKFGEFERRKEAIPEDLQQPSSPAMPSVRPALASKVDPFAAVTDSGIGAQQQSSSTAPTKKKAGKMAIFSDESGPAQSVLGSQDGQGWESLGTMASRKKENTKEAGSWAGQTLKTGKTNGGMGKMTVFKSSSESSKERSSTHSKHESQRSINPKTGRPEYVFVNLEAVYPNPQDPRVEFCFEELRAAHRGWTQRDWAKERAEVRLQPKAEVQKTSPKRQKKNGFQIFQDENVQIVAQSVPEPTPAPATDIGDGLKIMSLNDENKVPNNDENNENAMPTQEQRKQADIAKRLRREERANRTRKIKVMEVEHVKKETQTIQLNLASPSGPKMKRKKIAEPTMTINTREAMDEIYGIFSQPVQTTDEKTEDEEEEDSDDDEDDDDDYTSGAESTMTGKMSATGSGYGEETRKEIFEAQAEQEDETHGDEVVEDEYNDEQDDAEDKTDVTGWSDYTSSKHIPKEVANSPAKKAKMQIFQDDEEPQSLETPLESITPMESSNDGKYIPEPPEDYQPVTAQFRDRSVMANSRLPFMTPIVEHTESSLSTVRTEKDYFTAKTPCRQTRETVALIEEDEDEDLMSSPFQELAIEAANDKRKVLQASRIKSTQGMVTLNDEPEKKKPLARSTPLAEPATKGPIVKDAQVNPVDPALRNMILAQMRPSISTYEGYHAHGIPFNRGAEIRKYARAISKNKTSSNPDKTISTLSIPPMLELVGTENIYTIRRELGAGAFAPVYLIERAPKTANDEPVDEENLPIAQMGKGAFATHTRSSHEALKIEDSPPSAWEFYMLHTTHRRLGLSRAATSIVRAYELHLFTDTSLLIEEYRDSGTLLDTVNLARSIDGLSGGPGAGIEESLAAFFSIELLRAVEAMHKSGIVHGDIKGDNVLLRLDSGDLGAYSRSGGSGWAAKGVSFIDFGRGIDMRHFGPNTQFVADWPTSEADCAEMRELRPWTYQVDYHGLAGTIHSLLFGKYMATISEKADTGIGAKRYRIREGLKRYWNTEMWGAVFEVLLNPLQHLEREEGRRMPVLNSMRECRERLEGWLEGNAEKRDLRGMVRRLEEEIRRRKK